jgi:hypothetical protein
MRASELLGADVRTPQGRRVGVVTGLRCTLDGPRDGPVAAPRVRQLVVTGRGVGAALGYQQEGQRGPWPVRALIQGLRRHSHLVDVGLIDRVDAGTVRLIAEPHSPG